MTGTASWRTTWKSWDYKITEFADFVRKRRLLNTNIYNCGTLIHKTAKVSRVLYILPRDGRTTDTEPDPYTLKIIKGASWEREL